MVAPSNADRPPSLPTVADPDPSSDTTAVLHHPPAILVESTALPLPAQNVGVPKPSIVSQQHSSSSSFTTTLCEERTTSSTASQKHPLVRRKYIKLFGEWVDVTEWHKRHPGGSDILLFFEGEDATEAFVAFHDVSERAMRVMKTLPRVMDAEIAKIQNGGRETDSEKRVRLARDAEIRAAWAELRGKFVERGWFKPTPWIELLWVAVVLVLGWLLLTWTPAYWEAVDAGVDVFQTRIILLDDFSTSLIHYYEVLFSPRRLFSILLHYSLFSPLKIALKALPAVFLGLLGGQVGFLMHLFGHRSCFRHPKLDYWIQAVLECFVNGDSAVSWNVKHFKHHAKTNVVFKDSDIQPTFFWSKKLVSYFWPLKENESLLDNWGFTKWLPGTKLLAYQHYWTYIMYAAFCLHRNWQCWFTILGSHENGTALGTRRITNSREAVANKMADSGKAADSENLPDSGVEQSSGQQSDDCSGKSVVEPGPGAGEEQKKSGRRYRSEHEWWLPNADDFNDGEDLPPLPRRPDADQIAYKNRERTPLYFEAALVIGHWALVVGVFTRVLGFNNIWDLWSVVGGFL